MSLGRKSGKMAISVAGLGVAFCVALSFFLSSCKREADRKSTEPVGGIRTEVERGLVKVILTTDRKEISIAERLRFQIEIVADETYEVQLPPFGDKLEQFGIVDYHTTRPELIENSKVRVCRSYILEPFLSGDYVIPPMLITFHKKNEQAPVKHEIETEGMKIKVTSLLPEDARDLKIHEITPPVDLPRAVTLRAWIAVGVGALCLAIVAGILFRKHRSRQVASVAPAVPAHEIAFSELQALIDEHLIEAGKIKLFYQRMSSIVRHYIERRFGLHAPEQTTEEFLEALQSSDALNKDYRALLRDFLSDCDLVKFAEHRPMNEAIQTAVASCKSFILGTRQEAGG